MSALQTIWFFLLAFMVIMYAILDGFDLGVGIWFPFVSRNETHSERQILIQSIAPFWDGNEVWLLAVGGSLFAVFSDAYATALSALYIPLMLIIACLIFRAVAIEFREELPTFRGRNLSDLGFHLGSLIPAFFFGVILGNLFGGLPIDSTKNYTGTVLTLLTPYTILIGVVSAAAFAIHGAFYLVWRIQDELANKARNWVNQGVYVYLALVLIAVAATGILSPQSFENYKEFPFFLIFPLTGIGTIILARIYGERGEELKPFILSAISIAFFIFSVGISLYPNLIPAIEAGNSLTVLNASSSEQGLLVQLVVTISGLILVLAYTTWKYRIFSGKIEAS